MSRDVHKEKLHAAEDAAARLLAEEEADEAPADASPSPPGTSSAAAAAGGGARGARGSERSMQGSRQWEVRPQRRQRRVDTSAPGEGEG